MTNTHLTTKKRLDLAMIALANTKTIHFDIGDAISSFIVVDVEPEGGGILDFVATTTQLFVEGPPIMRANRVSFSPLSSVTSSLSLSNFLDHQQGMFFLKPDLIFTDYSNQVWKVNELVPPVPCLLVIETHVSVSPPALEPVPCPSCARPVIPPPMNIRSFAFACPACHHLVPHPAFPLWVEVGQATSPGRDLVLRIKQAIGALRKEDQERVQTMASLLSRLPRDVMGRLDWIVLDHMAMMHTAPRTTPPVIRLFTSLDVLDRLPVSIYMGTLEERCEICLESYMINVSRIRTLPCFHRFHVHCCDQWMALSQSCPLCKINVEDHTI